MPKEKNNSSVNRSPTIFHESPDLDKYAMENVESPLLPSSITNPVVERTTNEKKLQNQLQNFEADLGVIAQSISQEFTSLITPKKSTSIKRKRPTSKQKLTTELGLFNDYSLTELHDSTTSVKKNGNSSDDQSLDKFKMTQFITSDMEHHRYKVSSEDIVPFNENLKILLDSSIKPNRTIYITVDKKEYHPLYLKRFNVDELRDKLVPFLPNSKFSAQYNYSTLDALHYYGPRGISVKVTDELINSELKHNSLFRLKIYESSKICSHNKGNEIQLYNIVLKRSRD